MTGDECRCASCTDTESQAIRATREKPRRPSIQEVRSLAPLTSYQKGYRAGWDDALAAVRYDREMAKCLTETHLPG
jgi:hypothetical protein